MFHNEPTATKNEEALLTALIVADCFDRRFAPVVAESSSWVRQLLSPALLTKVQNSVHSH